MSFTPQVFRAYRIRDLLSWSSLVIASFCCGVSAGVGPCDRLSLAAAAEIAAICILAYLVFAILSIYLDRRARAILRAATGFSSLSFYFDAEGGEA